MNSRFILPTLLSITLLLPTSGNGMEQHEHGNHTPPTAQASGLPLSEGVKKLLIEEMQYLQKGVAELLPAIAAGEWHKVEAIGGKIHASYILKQRLTPAQREELHGALPDHFKELDAAFHQAAKMLVHAAKMGHAEIVNFYFYKLNDGCTKCHARFATHRFPGFNKMPAGGDEHHH